MPCDQLALLTVSLILLDYISTQGITQDLHTILLFDDTASMMGNFDSLSVLFNGAIYQYLVCPTLKRKGIHLKTTHKFAIGTALGGLSLLSAIFVDYAIHAEIQNGNGTNVINIFWQTFSFFFVGAGEILTISIAYDVAFTIAPKEQKGLASGINLFVIGALSNFICIGIYNSCAHWFPLDTTDPSDYVNSKIYNYLWVLFGISCFGVIFNLLPPVSRWLERTSNRAIELNTDRGCGDVETSASISDSYAESYEYL